LLLSILESMEGHRFVGLRTSRHYFVSRIISKLGVKKSIQLPIIARGNYCVEELCEYFETFALWARSEHSRRR